MLNQEMTIEQTFENIDNFLCNKWIESNLNSRHRETVISATSIMRSHLEKLVNQEDVCPSKEEVKTVLSASNSLLRLVILDSATQEFKKFIYSFILLTFNWNKVANNEDIASSINAMEHLIEFHNSMIATVFLLKHLIKEFEAMQNFNPPSYKVAKGYLDTLNKRLEEENNEHESKN